MYYLKKIFFSKCQGRKCIIYPENVPLCCKQDARMAETTLKLSCLVDQMPVPSCELVMQQSG